MMTLHNNEKNLREELNKEIEIPVIVHEKINNAYRMIEEHKVVQKTPRRSISVGCAPAPKLQAAWQP